MKHEKMQNLFLPELPEHFDKSCFPLYRHLLPKRSYKLWTILFCAGLVLIPMAAIGGYLCVMHEGGSMEDKGVVQTMLFMIIMLAAFILLSGGVLMALYRSEMRRYAKRWAIMDMLSVEEIIALEKEIAQAKLWFGTFHLLEHYLYVPQRKIIIYYGDIANWKQTISSGVHVIVSEQDGTEWQLQVSNWRAFLQDRTEFMQLLERRVRRCGGSL